MQQNVHTADLRTGVDDTDGTARSRNSSLLTSSTRKDDPSVSVIPSTSREASKERPRLDAFRQRYNHLSDDSWLWELAGILVCVSTLISIVAIFLAYDQKPQPHIAGGISVRWTRPVSHVGPNNVVAEHCCVNSSNNLPCRRSFRRGLHRGPTKVVEVRQVK
jgi:hypothetical protein